MWASAVPVVILRIAHAISKFPHLARHSNSGRDMLRAELRNLLTEAGLLSGGSSTAFGAMPWDFEIAPELQE